MGDQSKNAIPLIKQWRDNNNPQKEENKFSDPVILGIFSLLIKICIVVSKLLVDLTGSIFFKPCQI